MKRFTTILAIIFLATFTVAVSSCKRDPDPNPQPAAGSMRIEFNYVFGANEMPFELNKQYVHPKTRDTMTFTTLKFYVSNIKLQRADGSWWVQPESYYIVCNSCDALDQTDYINKTITVKDVPAGNYVAMEYTFGVDSARNVSGANGDALSFANGMFWNWNTGYIMMKAEGKSPNALSGLFALHFGGFQGDESIVTTKKAEFTSKQLNINSNKTGVVTLTANPARIWHSASTPTLDSVSVIHSITPVVKTMATDFYNGVYLKSVE